MFVSRQIRMSAILRPVQESEPEGSQRMGPVPRVRSLRSRVRRMCALAARYRSGQKGMIFIDEPRTP
jgi:hypothetical protein